jgi:hypothetical protein
MNITRREGEVRGEIEVICGAGIPEMNVRVKLAALPASSNYIEQVFSF